jgi:SAM-dependent methyltransferase
MSEGSSKARVIRAYASRLIKTYCTIRFRIINIRILEEIGQYLPEQGRILDVGCGFGLFTLFYALLAPGRNFVSLDVNAARIDQARAASELLNVSDRGPFRIGERRR